MSKAFSIIWSRVKENRILCFQSAYYLRMSIQWRWSKCFHDSQYCQLNFDGNMGGSSWIGGEAFKVTRARNQWDCFSQITSILESVLRQELSEHLTRDVNVLSKRHGKKNGGNLLTAKMWVYDDNSKIVKYIIYACMKKSQYSRRIVQCV